MDFKQMLLGERGSEGMDIDALSLEPVSAGAGHSADPEVARLYVEKVAHRKIEGFRGTIDCDGNYLSEVFVENKSLSAHVTADYHGRFLIELIQNGNDAHPIDGTRGEIEVVLDESEGAAGTLYVANKGAAFSDENVRALTNIGLSSKPPGQAIGNKGLGFRSVLHITDAPEVYSQASPVEPRPRFEGFCFTFADNRRLEDLIESEHIRAMAARDLPVFHIPRWLADQPDRVRHFAGRGFATVIRLPLRNAAALADVRKEINALKAQSAPMLLFLSRLERLGVKVQNPREDGKVLELELTRFEKKLDAKGPWLVTVDLGDSGRYLVAKAPIPEAKMKAAIADGIERKQLHASWAEWSGPGEVALGVRIDDGPVAPRLYTFLPMGKDAAAPFNGYLHGSFFPTSNRKAVESLIELNKLVLDTAAALAAKAVKWLVWAQPYVSANQIPLSQKAATSALVDLLVWRRVGSLEPDGDVPGSARLDLAKRVALFVKTAFDAESFAAASFVPCLAPRKTGRPDDEVVYRSPLSVRRLQAEGLTFTPRAFAEHGQNHDLGGIWPHLDAVREQALSEFLKAHSGGEYTDYLAAGERADFAEAIAKQLHARKAPRSAWLAFYRDLAPFIDDEEWAFTGRTIFLCSDGSLRAGRSVDEPSATAEPPRRRRRRGQIEASVFFPPQPRPGADPIEDDGLKIPRDLKDYFAFVADDLPWFGELKETRELFEGSLVERFDSDTVLTRLAQVSTAEASHSTRIACLRWAFAIWTRAAQAKRPVTLQPSHRLYVPTRGGDFLPATEAAFSGGWPEETLGRRLQQFLDLAPPDNADMNSVRARLLAEPNHYAFRTRLPDWTRFLSEMGVKRGLWPVAKKFEHPVRASDLYSLSICDELGYPESFKKVWRNDIVASSVDKGRLPSTTNYVLSGTLWWYPGQADHETFDRECREQYATLVVDWLASALDNPFWLEVHHQHSHRVDTRAWPTPLATFLRATPWMPAEEGAARNHFRPGEIWLSNSQERYPPFLRRPTLALSRALDRTQDAAIRRLIDIGKLRILGTTSTLLDQAEFLAEQFASGVVSRHSERAFLNVYHETWRRIAEQFAKNEAAFSDKKLPALLVVRKGEQTEAVSVATAAEGIYVRDCADDVVPNLLRACGRMLIEPREPTEALGRVCEQLFAGKVTPTSKVEYKLRVDGLSLDELTGDVPLVEVCPWIRSMAAVAMEGLHSADKIRLPADHSIVLDKLDRVRLRFAQTVTFELDGLQVQPPEPRQAYRFARESGELVVALHQGQFGWPHLEQWMIAICEAIEVPMLAPNMRLLALDLGRRQMPVDEGPVNDADITALGQVFSLGARGLDSARQTLGDRLDRYATWLRALVHYEGDDEAYGQFIVIEQDALESVAGLRKALSTWFDDGRIDAMIEACRSSFSVQQFRNMLGLEFARFNRSLIKTGGLPDVDPRRHATQLAHFVFEHEADIINAIRNAYAPQLAAGVAAPEYPLRIVEARELSPDVQWEPLYEVVPEDILFQHVNDWLASFGAPKLGQNPHALAPFQKVRAANFEVVGRFAKAAPLVRTWCIARLYDVNDVWADTSTARSKLQAALQAEGVFDHAELTDAEMFAWCQRLGIWPAQMPASFDLGVLGIKEEELKDADEEERRAKAEREVKARLVKFNGEDVDPLEVDWQDVSAQIANGLSKKAKSAGLNKPTPLAAVEKRERRSKERKPGAKHEKTQRVPQEKKDMIGRLGELVVYHWLKDRYRDKDIDAAWKSENAISVGPAGNDGLGYDFELQFARQTWFIEVKASVGDTCRFEMGETEVRKAREAARPRSNSRYVIAYVANAGEPSRAMIEILPNPMSEEADGVLELLGEGVRYGFERR